MTFIANYWLAFLAATVILWIVTFILQVRNMNNLGRAAADMLNQGSSNFFNRFIPVIICGVLGTVCGLLAIIGAIVTAVAHLQA